MDAKRGTAVSPLREERQNRRVLLGGLLGGMLALRSQSAVTQCELIELYPGYPGYQGYITGLDGIGDHACLAELEAMDPDFLHSEEDRENREAAQRLGLAGTKSDWTWENWMAIEAERGLPPTCYFCALAAADRRPEPFGAPVPPDDPRLLIGSFDTTTALSRLRAEFNLPAGSLEPALPFDASLRAIIGMANPGQHWNAPQLLAGYEATVEGIAQQGQWFDAGALGRNLLDQGGYAPTPPSATPDDQIFMVGAGVAVLSRLVHPMVGPGLMRELGAAESAWLSERLKGSTISFAEWIRTSDAFAIWKA